jgi:hypothetical protein
MIKCIYNGFDDNTLTILNSSEALEDGKEYYFKIISDIRTYKQNAYLHVVFNLVKDWYNLGNENPKEINYSQQQAKARILFENGHADYFIASEDGVRYGIIKATRDLSKKDFSELTENIIKHYAVKGLNILTPQEYFET